MLFNERVKLSDAMWLFVGEVTALSYVVFQIEKLLAVLTGVTTVKDSDEFPIALVNTHRRWQPIGHTGCVWKIRKDGVAIESFATQRRRDTDAVKMLSWFSFDREQIQQGRIKITALNRLVTPRT